MPFISKSFIPILTGISTIFLCQQGHKQCGIVLIVGTGILFRLTIDRQFCYSASFAIVLILGMTMCFTGALLKSWIIIIGGFILGVGGAAATMLIMSDAELLLFTVGGLLLVAIGLIEKHQNK